MTVEPTTTRPPLTAGEIADLLVARRYEAPEWFTLREVPPTKGGSRHLDLVAWNTFASRGLMIDGVEIKVSRGDWLRELKDAAKAEATFAMVERFFVAAPEGVVKLEELPPEWGLIEVRGSRLFNLRTPKPRPRGDYSKAEVVGIMRRVQACWSTPERCRDLKRQICEANQLARARFEELEKELERKREVAERELQDLLNAIGARWSGDRIKACGEFRALLERFGDGKDALAEAKRSAERGIAELQKLILGISKLRGGESVEAKA